MSNLAKLLFLVLFGISALVLQSCNNLKIDSTETPPVMFVQTIQAYSTPLRVADYPGQVSDGKLLLTISLVGNKCIDVVKEWIEIELIFRNLTNESLKLGKGFSAAINRIGTGGNIVPLFESSNGEDILTRWDYERIDIFGYPPTEYITIPAEDEFHFLMKFKFPNEIVVSVSNDGYDTTTPSPGEYFFRLVYVGPQRNDGAWFGRIGSNQIKICVAN